MLPLLSAVLILALPVGAQTVSGQISGTVFDSSNAVVPGAPVSLRSTATGNVRKTATNENGYYVFADLLPGSYDLTVDREGFRRSTQTGVLLSANSRITVNATLSPGAVADQHVNGLRGNTTGLMVDGTTYGQVTSTGPARTTQLGLKLEF